MDNPEKRRYQRMPIRLDLSCQKINSFAENRCAGRTINVSAGGFCFQTSSDGIKQGDLLNVEFSIPPTTGLLEYGGRISGFARVLRTEDVVRISSEVSLSSGRFGIAAEFCQPLRLSP